ncbi:Ankyrin repeat domain-containing protein 52 [Lambiella insularis]|nr:Ankyrin repeat domain-containing protein 52 [Lambiella insularis]
MEIWKHYLVESPYRRGYDLLDEQPQFDHFKFTSLHAAVLNIDSVTLNATITTASRLAINARDAMGRTALFWAVLCGDIYAVKQLLWSGADPNVADSRGSTPLHQWVMEGSEQMLDALLEAEANINARDYLGRTVLMEMTRCREFDAEILHRLFSAQPTGVQGTCKVPRRDKSLGNSIPPIEGPVQNESENLQPGIHDRTPLMFKATGQTYQVLMNLLDKGADYTLRDAENRSLLHIAADYGHVNGLRILHQANLEFLDVDGKNSSGNTAMDIATWRRDKNVEWARWAIREPDADPREWFHAFQNLYLEGVTAFGKSVVWE